MCRLLAYVSDTERSVEDVLGSTDFAVFRELSRLDRDGWGMSWLARSDRPVPPEQHAPHAVEARLGMARSLLPAWEDPAFEAAARRRLGRAGFVHLRWATSGLAVAESNTHPFLADGWAFAHQGSIPFPDRLEALLSPDWLRRRQGATDSETYFLYILQCVERAGSLVGGIRQAVTEIQTLCGPSSLNAVLLSESALVVVHGWSGLEPPREDLLAAFADPAELPRDHLDGYFGLRCRRRDGSLVVTSSGVSGPGWEDVQEDSILLVDLDDGEMSVHPFAGLCAVS